MDSSRIAARRRATISLGAIPGIALLVMAAMAAMSATPAPAAAQVFAPEFPARRTIDLPLLLDLPGDFAFVRYTPGTLDRSAAVQARFERFAHDFQMSGYPASTLVIYVFSREDWKEAGLHQPYGMPEPLGLEAIAVPAYADAPVVKTWRELLGGALPVPQGQPILITPEESGALAVIDLVTQLEVARMLVKRAKIHGDSFWIEPLVVHLVARLFWDHYEPGRVHVIAETFDRLAANDKTPGGHRLTEWKDGLPFAERCWFDARFMRGADVLVAKSSERYLWKRLERDLTRKQPLTEAWLFKEYKPLKDWISANFAP